MMKKTKIIFGTLGIVAVAAIVAVTPWGKNINGQYAQKDLPSLESQNANDAQKWLEARYIDETTGERVSSEKLALIQKQILAIPKNKSISFVERGPDNIGGRTRAIQIDRSNINRVWAGGASGGIFVTENRANTWTRVDSYMDAGASPNVSSMTQTIDGTLYVATGSNQEGWAAGNGVWYSTDAGATWAKIPGTTASTEVESNDVDNFVWMATSSGLKKWKVGDAAITAVTGVSGSCSAFKMSKDGQVIVGAFSSNKTYVSNDGGSSWTDKSGSGATVVPVGSQRIEYAISQNKVGGNYSIYAVRTNANLSGMNVSHDNGQTWSQFIGPSGTPSNLDIYRNQGTYNSIVTVSATDNEKILIGGIDIWKWKQTTSSPAYGGFEKLSQWFLSPSSSGYVHADNHEMKWDNTGRLYVGNDGGVGITINEGQSWYPANRGYNVTQYYGIAFDKDGSVMGGAQDNGTTYNDHFLNTKEFREVGGGDGMSCEISFYNPNVMFSSIYYNSFSRSSDRGQSWGAFVPALPSTYAAVGTEGSIHPFQSSMFLAEYYDTNSQDSVIYIPSKNIASGTQIKVPSRASGDSMNYTTTTNLWFDDTAYFDPAYTILDVSIVNAINGQTVLIGNYGWTPFPSASGTPTNPSIGDTLTVHYPTGDGIVVVQSKGTYTHYYAFNPNNGKKLSLGVDTYKINVAWDTLIVQDPYQSWFLFYVNINGGEIWGTRSALQMSNLSPIWVKIAQGIGGSNAGSNETITVDVEFSKNLNHCYISTGAGGVYRIDGLGSVYISDPNFKKKAGYWVDNNTGQSMAPIGTTKTQITTSNYQGIAINPSNANDLVVFSGFGGAMKRSLNATSATPTFTALTPITNPAVACYDGIIDRDDSDVLVVGTSNGVFVSENGGGSWTNASAGFEGTPVYHVRQSWRTWNEGNRRPGEIYIGTYGRGIWASASYLGIDENGNGTNGSEFKTKLKVYPNPTIDNATLTFNLKETSNVAVYVYSISGVLVKTFTEKNVSEGAQTIKIDSDDLTNGTYIVKLIAGKQNDTVKFIKR